MSEPRVWFDVKATLVERLEAEVANGRYATIEAVLDAALDTRSLDDWRVPRPGSGSALVHCECCRPGHCQQQFRWRGVTRCGCADATKDAGSGIVQSDLER